MAQYCFILSLRLRWCIHFLLLVLQITSSLELTVPKNLLVGTLESQIFELGLPGLKSRCWQGDAAV